MPTRVCFNNTTQNQQLSHQIIVRHETVIGLILYEVHKLNLAKVLVHPSLEVVKINETKQTCNKFQSSNILSNL